MSGNADTISRFAHAIEQPKGKSLAGMQSLAAEWRYCQYQCRLQWCTHELWAETGAAVAASARSVRRIGCATLVGGSHLRQRSNESTVRRALVSSSRSVSAASASDVRYTCNPVY